LLHANLGGIGFLVGHIVGGCSAFALARQLLMSSPQAGAHPDAPRPREAPWSAALPCRFSLVAALYERRALNTHRNTHRLCCRFVTTAVLPVRGHSARGLAHCYESCQGWGGAWGCFLFLKAVLVFFLSGQAGFQNVFLAWARAEAVAPPAIRAWPRRDSTR
jgi:hypothetical protein